MLTACVVVDIASIYLAQPLLPFIGDDLGAGTGAMSAVQALLQLAFGTGLLVFGVLADTRERRRLMSGMATGLIAASVLAAAAPTYAVFLLATLMMGACAAVTPVVIAAAATLGDRRALLGVLSGTPLGVVAGRTLSGAIGQVDWRLAFVLAAVSAAATLLLLRLGLPEQPPLAGRARMHRALAELGALARLPGNLVTNLSNSVVYVGWSAVWTMLAFLLKDRPFELGPLGVGLVGLVALGGVVAGPLGGRLDRTLGEARAARLCLAIATLAGLALAGVGSALVPLLVALAVHNASIWTLQAVNIPATARRAGPHRAARGTALLYITNFLATAAGAALGALVWSAAGWPGVGLVAAGSCLVGMGLDLAGRPAALASARLAAVEWAERRGP